MIYDDLEQDILDVVSENEPIRIEDISSRLFRGDRSEAMIAEKCLSLVRSDRLIRSNYGFLNPHRDISKVWIRTGIKPLQATFDSAARGFELKGELVKRYTSLDQTNYIPGDIIVGPIAEVNIFLTHVLPLDYPDTLRSYLGRKITKDTLENCLKLVQEGKSLFLKSVDQKALDGMVLNSVSDCIRVAGFPSTFQVWRQEVIDIESEWRVYVLEGRVLKVCHYKGDPLTLPDVKVIRSMIQDYSDAPVAYSLDVGINSQGTFLIEANAAYSLGNYGLDPVDYADMIEKSWKSLDL